jgi:peptide/nickel transport system permease protein
VTAHGAPARTTQWRIVARQFRKRRLAVWGLRVTVGLFLLATYAPVLCSGLPFLWRGPGGDLEFPWASRLFDENHWEHPLDRFFNLLMIAIPAFGLGRLAIRGMVPPERRGLARKRLHLGLGAVLLAVVGVQALGLGLLSRQPHPDYRGLRGRIETAQARARAEPSDLEPADALARELVGRDPTVPRDPRTPTEAEARRLALERTREAVLAWDGPAVFPPVPYGYREQLEGLAHRYRKPLDFAGGERHVLGTDEIGRDVFARIVYGTRISMTIGIFSVAIYVFIGVVLGSLAGYFRGKVDLVIMRLVEVMITIPPFFLIIAIIAFSGSKSIFLIMFAIAIVSWTGVARLVRGEFFREREKDYVSAARALGLGPWRIAFRHVLPNALGPVLVAASFGVPGAILTEAGLSFLGLGDLSVPSWGRILEDGRTASYWHMIVPPAVAIFVTMTALNLVGDGLRDALDPKLRN